MFDVDLKASLIPIKFIGKGHFIARLHNDNVIYLIKQVKIDNIDKEDILREARIHRELSQNCVNIVQYCWSLTSARGKDFSTRKQSLGD